MPEFVVRKISGHSQMSREFFRYVSLAQSYQDKETEIIFNKLKVTKLNAGKAPCERVFSGDHNYTGIQKIKSDQRLLHIGMACIINRRFNIMVKKKGPVFLLALLPPLLS